MADINDPQLAKPINDDEMQSQEEIIEKPYYDNGSASTIQNPDDNNQPEIQNPSNNPPSYNLPIDIQSQDQNQNNMQAPIYNPNNNQIPYYNLIILLIIIQTIINRNIILLQVLINKLTKLIPEQVFIFHLR